jgi:cold shock CspA family protein
MTSRVFISYAKEDKESAVKLYWDLRYAGVKPWIDSVDLIAGQHWESTIRKEIRDSDYFLALVSSRSVKKKGFVQKEIRHALEIAKEYPENEIYILVLRLDDCEPSFEDLRRLHWTDLFTSYEDALVELLRAFKYASEEKPALVSVDTEKRDGKIVRMNDKGFGFIGYSYIKPDIFFHSNELQNISYDELREGDVVLFSIAKGPKGQVAVDVERV